MNLKAMFWLNLRAIWFNELFWRLFCSRFYSSLPSSPLTVQPVLGWVGLKVLSFPSNWRVSNDKWNIKEIYMDRDQLKKVGPSNSQRQRELSECARSVFCNGLFCLFTFSKGFSIWLLHLFVCCMNYQHWNQRLQFLQRFVWYLPCIIGKDWSFIINI